MNLHGIVSPLIGRVNPSIQAALYVSSGYTKAADHSQVPAYRPRVMVTAQVQALTVADLRQLDNINQSGASNTAYLYGQVEALNREDKKGGDLLVFGGWEYLITAVLEAWPDWCKVALQRQGRRAS